MIFSEILSKQENEDMDSLLMVLSTIIIYCSNPVNYCEVIEVKDTKIKEYNIKVCVTNGKVADLDIGIVDLNTEKSEIIKYNFVGCTNG